MRYANEWGCWPADARIIPRRRQVSFSIRQSAGLTMARILTIFIRGLQLRLGCAKTASVANTLQGSIKM